MMLGGDDMQSIHIIADGNKVKIVVDGVTFTDLHSFSLDYVKGCPLLFSCVANVGGTQEQQKILH
jgi:hypothetical protein